MLHAQLIRHQRDELTVGELFVGQGYTVHRDTFHASYGLGRYALALTWLRALTGADVSGVALPAYDEPIAEDALNFVQQTVMKLLP